MKALLMQWQEYQTDETSRAISNTRIETVPNIVVVFRD